MRRSSKKILILIILIVAALIAAASYFLLSFYVPNEQAEVQGNLRYTDAEIRRMAMPGFKEHNSLYLRFFRNQIPLPEVPFIDSIEVEYLERDRVRLHANEEYPVGYLLEGGYRHYFNSSGIVTETLDDAAQKKEEQKKDAEKKSTEETASDTSFRPALTDVSQVTGLTDAAPAVGQQIQAADGRIFQTLLAIGKLANKLDIHPDEILIDADQTMTLRYEEVRIDIGTERLLDEKMSRAAAILPQLEGMKGTLHLENYSPSTINIVFSAWREEDELKEAETAEPETVETENAEAETGETETAEEWYPEETYVEEEAYYADDGYYEDDTQGGNDYGELDMSYGYDDPYLYEY